MELRYKLIILILLFILINEVYCNVVINALTNSENGLGSVYSKIVDEFNNYSRDNNLNITLNLYAFTKEKFTLGVTDYQSTIETLLHKGSKKYDLYFYDSLYTRKLAPYLSDLKELIPEEYLNLFDPQVTSQTCIYKNRWVGLPINIDATVLYYNKTLLDRYNEPIPRTWDQLLETGKRIVNEEKIRLNKTTVDFIPYNGLFTTQSEIGTCSIYEFIYSFRKSKKDPYPEVKSQESVNALNMMKRLKNELAGEYLDKNFIYSRTHLHEEKYLFLKFWFTPSLTTANFTILPGANEDLSGSVLGGYNLGLNRQVSENRLNASIEAFKFLISKEMQKKLLIEDNVVSSISSLYNDPEVCSVVHCETFKNIQFIARPTSIIKDYNEYSENVRKYINEFLYEDKPMKQVLKKIEDMIKIHYIQTNSFLGIFIITLNSLFMIIMLLSLVVLFIEKLNSYFKFLSKDFWIISVIGSCLMVDSLFVELGEIKVDKCHFKPFLLCIGFSLNMIPILHKLVVNFPEKNKFSDWIAKKRYLFLAIFLLFDIIANLIFISSPYKIREEKILNGKRFYSCKVKTKTGNFVSYLMIIYRIFILIIILFLIFIEWGIKETSNDLKFLLSASFVDVICYLIFIILKQTNFRKNNYIAYYIVYSTIVTIFSLSNYIFLYGKNIIWYILNKNGEESEEDFIKNLKYQFNKSQNDTTQEKNNISKTVEIDSDDKTSTYKKNGIHNISNKLINYHNREALME